MKKFNRKIQKCSRCNWEWFPRKKNIKDIRICPKCKSPYFNVSKKDKDKDKK